MTVLKIAHESKQAILSPEDTFQTLTLQKSVEAVEKRYLKEQLM